MSSIFNVINLTKSYKFLKKLNVNLKVAQKIVDRIKINGQQLRLLIGVDERTAVEQQISALENTRDNVIDLYEKRHSNLIEAIHRITEDINEFDNKLDTRLVAMVDLAQQVRNQESISARPDRIREQIAENSTLMKHAAELHIDNVPNIVARAQHDEHATSGLQYLKRINNSFFNNYS